MLATWPLGADRADLRINFFLAKNLFVRISDSEMLFGCFGSELWRRGRIFLDLTWSPHQNRLKQHSSRHRAQQCESHHLPHAKSGVPASTTPIVPAIAAMRCRCKKSSSGTRRQKPTGMDSPGGFRMANIAGTKVILQANATNMPQPAINPNSKRPL
jgi:hypothetical protein